MMKKSKLEKELIWSVWSVKRISKALWSVDFVLLEV